jgi:hypothetical protein
MKSLRPDKPGGALYSAFGNFGMDLYISEWIWRAIRFHYCYTRITAIYNEHRRDPQAWRETRKNASSAVNWTHFGKFVVFSDGVGSDLSAVSPDSGFTSAIMRFEGFSDHNLWRDLWWRRSNHKMCINLLDSNHSLSRRRSIPSIMCRRKSGWDGWP